MPRTTRDDNPEDWDDDGPEDWESDDDEQPEEFDDEDGDPDERTIPCPYCREPLFEDAEYCGRCENYISRESTPGESKPAWIWICLILALGAAIFWAMG